ncbi:Gfo/Idh/MocA family protein [Tichowtungia aerotolerans]|uniref:Gfo/Idh/MocA family oxidoreductase n=1 Tax=Tichowtungia aerotolerans TaxID=2697043 RepID=A0A6P1MBA0_9BACT|nr:Gfo/Idh/MocA family oxidoreductase [Tichowtungia aerotolerans]QHI68395.1 Gfo/Idh/MocA family oxidoreductase [Tichowtungia aerotolerans]
MSSSFKWGIIGCGLIAPKFFQALENTGEGHVVAAASKSMRRARRIQQKLGIECAYGSYAEMLEHEKLDAVYIANTHAEHYQSAKLCFEHNLPVLVEKAFTRNEAEAEELIDLAGMKNLMLMEAMWTRFNPATVKIRELLADGAIGEVIRLKAAFGVKMPLSMKTMPWNRMYNPYLAGGALLDLGVYPLAYARMVFGRRPERIGGSAKMAWTGVDKTSEYHLDYGGGRRADLMTSFVEQRPRDAVITGTKGIITVPHFSGADRLTLTRPGGAPEVIECGANGFEHEILEFHRCLREGLTESPGMPLSETLDVMRTADALRTLWGMKYPGE